MSYTLTRFLRFRSHAGIPAIDDKGKYWRVRIIYYRLSKLQKQVRSTTRQVALWFSKYWNSLEINCLEGATVINIPGAICRII